MIKDTGNFGSGSFVGDVMSPESDFFELSVADQARYLGWVAACPVVEELIGPANTAPGRGAEAMARRYGAVAFWHGFIARQIMEENPALSYRLRMEADREQDEQVGKYEPGSVPEDYDEYYSPVGKLVGFALPRMFIEHISQGGSEHERATRLAAGIRVAEDAASWSKLSEEDFLARTAEGLAREGTPPERLLKHIAGQGWLDEHNGRRMLDKAMLSLREHAPLVWEAYEGLSEAERRERNLVDFDPLAVEYEPSGEDLRNLFEGLQDGLRQAAHNRHSRSQQLNEYKHLTEILIKDAEAGFITGEDDVESVEIGLQEPTDDTYGEWIIHVSAYYGQPGMPGKGFLIKSWRFYKTTGSSRGDEYSLQKSRPEMYIVPGGDNEAVPGELEVPDDAAAADFDEDTPAADTRIGIDDIAMLNRLMHVLAD